MARAACLRTLMPLTARVGYFWTCTRRGQLSLGVDPSGRLREPWRSDPSPAMALGTSWKRVRVSRLELSKIMT